MATASSADAYYITRSFFGVPIPQVPPELRKNSYWKEDLETIVNSITVILEPLGPSFMHSVRNSMSFVTKFTPKFLSTSNFYHASFYVPVNSKEGILCEYGAYGKLREGDYHIQPHYYNDEREGLRYARFREMDLYNEKYKPGTFLIACNLKKKGHTLRYIFDQIIRDATINFEKKEYSFFTNNCQYFVGKAIKVTGAYRSLREIQRCEKYHIMIPPRILKQFQRNELIVEENEKTPVKSIFFTFEK